MLDKVKGLENIFKNNNELTFHIESRLNPLSTMKLESQGHFVEAQSIEALSKLIEKLTQLNIKYKIIGLGSNFIIEKSPDYIIVKPDFPFEKNDIDPKEDSFEINACAPIKVLTAIAIKHGFKGWESFTGVPANLGGAIAMNAGTAHGEICDIVKAVTLMDTNGKLFNHCVTKESFSYRKNNFLAPGQVIVSATLTHHGVDKSLGEKIKSYLRNRTLTQPLTAKTCGCMFKNANINENSGIQQTCRAGMYIDIMGLKGLSINNLRVSPKHANFMENTLNSTATDVKDLVEVTKHELKKQYGVDFETEVHFA